MLRLNYQSSHSGSKKLFRCPGKCAAKKTRRGWCFPSLMLMLLKKVAYRCRVLCAAIAAGQRHQQQNYRKLFFPAGSSNFIASQPMSHSPALCAERFRRYYVIKLRSTVSAIAPQCHPPLALETSYFFCLLYRSFQKTTHNISIYSVKLFFLILSLPLPLALLVADEHHRHFYQ
jgi:hypothetical protein